jgi:hypothetical protein
MLEAIYQFCLERRSIVILIEDNAQSSGCGKKHYPQIAVLTLHRSIQPKILGAYGDAGAVLCNDNR